MVENPGAPLFAILVVEDEFLLRSAITSALMDQGFQVAQAQSAHEALELLRCSSSFNVILTDIQMPGSMDGLDLANHVRRQWPEIKIILMSGHLTSMPSPMIADAFLAKPFPLPEAIECVGHLLAKSA